MLPFLARSKRPLHKSLAAKYAGKLASGEVGTFPLIQQSLLCLSTNMNVEQPGIRMVIIISKDRRVLLHIQRPSF